MRLHGPHEQTIPLPLSHDELVQLQRRVAQAGLAADLGGQGHYLARAAGRSPGPPSGLFRRGDPVLLSIKVLFKLPLGQTAGMVASLLRLAGLDWPVPDFSTLCRRQKTLPSVPISVRQSTC